MYVDRECKRRGYVDYGYGEEVLVAVLYGCVKDV